MSIDGFLNINKPAGPTSHDIVRTLKRILIQDRKIKIGHTGTLDPPATGVLVIAIGKGNRLVEYVLKHPKEYTGIIRLGAETDTLDCDGDIIQTKDVPVFDQGLLDDLSLKFTGKIKQVPPLVSALKKDGVRYYVKARRGEPQEPPPARDAFVYDLALKKHDDETIDVYVKCASGFYVRSLARDIAYELGTVGHLDMLIRTAVGGFKLANALDLEWIEKNGPDPTFREKLYPSEFPLNILPSIEIPDDEVSFFRQGMGRWIDPEHKLPENTDLAVYCSTGFVGIGTIEIVDEKPTLKPRKVIVNE